MTKSMWVGNVVVVVLSLLAACFGVFNVLFSDIFGVSQHVQAIGYILIIYGVIGYLSSRLWPAGRQAWRWWLIVPALLIGLPFSFGDGTFGWYPIGVMSAMVIGTLFGTGFHRRPKPAVV